MDSRTPPPAFRPRVSKSAAPWGSEAGRRGLILATVVRSCLRLAPRRPAGVLGLWYPDPGASRAASRKAWAACGGASTHFRHLSRLPYAWQPCPLGGSASNHPRVDSGLTSELAHAVVLSAWPGTTPEPPNHPAPQPLVMISLRCAGRGSVAWGAGAGISWVADKAALGSKPVTKAIARPKVLATSVSGAIPSAQSWRLHPQQLRGPAPL